MNEYTYIVSMLILSPDENRSVYGGLNTLTADPLSAAHYECPLSVYHHGGYLAWVDYPSRPSSAGISVCL